jgi:hypothetical protein
MPFERRKGIPPAGGTTGAGGNAIRVMPGLHLIFYP